MRMLDAARRLGVSTATLKRFLVLDNHLGLVKRTPGGHYRFTEEDVRKLDYAMTQAGLHGGKASLEIGRCERCQGFFIRRYPGQRFCYNSCGANKPCTCGTYKRKKVIIA